MCNLYTERKSAAEVAAHFGIELAPGEFNLPEEVVPGYPGMVVRETEGRRRLEKAFRCRKRASGPACRSSRRR